MAKKASPSKASGGSSAAKSPPPAVKKKPAVASPESELRRLDREIVKLLNQRTALYLKWVNHQPSPSKAIFAPGQDEEVWLNIEQANHGPLPATSMRSVFRELLSGARGLVKTKRVAYLGPAFSYTHIAALERFGTTADFVPVGTIASVFEEVNRGRADFGIVPIENSTDGRIVDTLDMFTRLPLKICAEVQLAIRHNLLANCERSEITEIYSKPQALSQCREWLNRNMPQARLIEVTSTSTAAQLARDKHGAAAVASRQAASQYDLQIIAEDIQDNKNNVTRFAVIGDEPTQATGRDKTAVLLQIAHEPGSLSDALVMFKTNKVNLTWIESFPLRGPEAGYLFFLDFEGHVSEPRIKKTIAELEKKAVRLELLGSFPKSEPID
jgi:chorismate mutase/prephenate dehydratase